jgi:Asp-tRNA(Asn)/Glu-tRNA(Gln) amidotransferase A subunit family amidase
MKLNRNSYTVIARKKCANQAWRFFRTYDLLLTPTIACPPFKQGIGIQGPELIEGKKAAPFQWIAFTSIQHDRTARGHRSSGLHQGRAADRLADCR